MQKIVTLDGFGVRADPREHLVKKRLIVKVLQTFEVVWGPRGPRISILGLKACTLNYVRSVRPVLAWHGTKVFNQLHPASCQAQAIGRVLWLKTLKLLISCEVKL